MEGTSTCVFIKIFMRFAPVPLLPSTFAVLAGDCPLRVFSPLRSVIGGAAAPHEVQICCCCWW